MDEPTMLRHQHALQRRAKASPYGAARIRRNKRHSEAQEGKAPARGLFSRLVRYIPLVGQLVASDYEEEEDQESEYEAGKHKDTIMTTTTIETETAVMLSASEDEDEEDDKEDEAMQEHKEAELEKASKEFALAAAAGMTTDDDTEYSGNLAASPEQKSTQGLHDHKSASPSSSERVKENAETVTPQRHGKDTHAEEGIASRLRDRVSPGHKSSPRDRTSELGPIIRSRLRKNSNSHRAFLPTTAQKSKVLKIGEVPSPHDSSDSYGGFKRVNRRRHKMSPSDSPLAAIARKKTISYDEYERLAKQLRGLVEPTPQAALALTQNALARGLEEPTIRSSPAKNVAEGAYVPGSMSTRHHEETKTIANGTGYELARSQNEGAPFAKRARTTDSGPIYFSKGVFRSQLLTREERLERKPRPSRLLTGLKREDSLARSAYSAAVAEKILHTLNKVQNPLEREAKKPTPSTSLSWAKYHLALVEDRSTPSEECKDADELPPTSTLPTVTFPLPQQKTSSFVATKPVGSTPSTTKTKTFTFATPTAKLIDFGAGTDDVLTPFFSPPIVSTTPAKPSTNVLFQKVSSNITTASTGTYSFTIPASCDENSFVQQKSYEDDENGIAYMFSPPPSQQEPPKKATRKRPHKSGVEAPFSFMPASPKVDSFVSSVKMKEASTTNIATKSTIEPPATSLVKSASNVEVNPLARFMQVEAGSWKCPSCSVTNGPKYSKCPCCEADKPSDTVKSSNPTTSSDGLLKTTEEVNPLARFMHSEPGSWKCPSCAVTNGPKYSKCPCCETEKPGGATSASSPDLSKSSIGGKISSGGFSFGAPAENEKPAAEAPSSARSSFGFPSTDKKSDDSTTKPSFSFGFSSQEKKQDDTEAAKPSFSFGVPPSSLNTERETTMGSSGFSFGANTSVTDTSTKPSFSFGLNSSSSTDSTATNGSTNVTFGGSTSSGGKRKAEDSPPEVQQGIGSVSTPGFSFGVAPEDSVETEIEPKRKRAAFTTMTSSKPETVPAFSFGSAPAVDKESKPATPVAAETQPAFSFGTVSTTEPTEKKASFSFGSGAAASKPGFSFGASTLSATPASVPVSVKDSEAKPSFIFGNQASTTPTGKSESFSLGTTTTSSTSGFGGVSFGSAPTASSSSSGFSFGVQPKVPTEVKTSSVDTSKKEEPKPFSFGATSKPAPTADKPTFSFGVDAAKSTSSSFGGPSFGAAPSATATPAAPSFTFGSKEPVAPTIAATAAPSQPSFTFGSSAPASDNSTAPLSSGFGTSASASVLSGFGAPAATTSFGSGAFGASPSTSFGAAPTTSATTFGTPATTSTTTFGTPATTSTTTFGTPATTSTGAFGSASTASNFGSAPSTTFGAPSATGFRSSSPSPAFGAPATSFGGAFSSSSQAASAPSTAFGSIAANNSFGSAPAISFGSTPTTFGAPATGFRSPSPAFGTPSPAPATGFGGPSPPPPTAFGAPTAASTNVFGGPSAAPSTGFGASTTFGAPTASFGANPGASSGFGAPSNTGFGAPAAGAFGAPANAGFGAAGTFGAQNTGGFGAPADGGFNIGAAPSSNPKGRRILKAKTRTKRQ